MFLFIRKKSGFSLMEILVVLLVGAVAISLIHTIFAQNIRAFLVYSAQKRLYTELQQINAELLLEMTTAPLAATANGARDITIFLQDMAGTTQITYRLAGGAFTKNPGLANERVFSTSLDTANSFFQINGSVINVELVLQETVWGINLRIPYASQFLMRN